MMTPKRPVETADKCHPRFPAARASLRRLLWQAPSTQQRTEPDCAGAPMKHIVDIRRRDAVGGMGFAPSALPKISTTRILTKSTARCHTSHLSRLLTATARLCVDREAPARADKCLCLCALQVRELAPGFCASASAQLLPAMPTQMPQTRLENPTHIPCERRAGGVQRRRKRRKRCPIGRSLTKRALAHASMHAGGGEWGGGALTAAKSAYPMRAEWLVVSASSAAFMSAGAMPMCVFIMIAMIMP